MPETTAEASKIVRGLHDGRPGIAGATASLFPEFNEGGVEAGKMIARILKGESPGSIPFYRVEKTKVAVNPSGAGKVGSSCPRRS